MALDKDFACRLADLTGLSIDQDRCGEIGPELEEFLRGARWLDQLDLGETEPAVRYSMMERE